MARTKSFGGFDSSPGHVSARGVDAADFTVWRDHLGQTFTLDNERPDAATPGVVDGEDYDFLKVHFGESYGSEASAIASAPEPASALLFLLGAARTGH